MDTREILTRFKSGTLARDQAAALLTGFPVDAPASDAAAPGPDPTPEVPQAPAPATGPESRGVRGPAAGRYAITAVHGRFPYADGLDAFWRTAVGGTGNGRRIEGADEFDAEFFGLEPAAAALLDPQERLLLETVWQTLEHAGHTGARLDALTAADGEPRAVGVYVAHGPTAYAACRGALPGRLSALLDLRGPSQCVDSGASSFLGALHLALGALRDGECAAALVAAVDLRQRDADAADCVGAVLVRPLEAARAAGDSVHAVIRASAVAHAGRAAPADADARLARRAQRAAGLDALDISLCESSASAGDAGAATGFTVLVRAVLQLTHGTLLPLPDGPDTTPWPRPRDLQGRELPRRASVTVRGECGTAAHLILEEHLAGRTGPRDSDERTGPASCPAELVLLSAPTPHHLAATARLLAERLSGDADAPVDTPQLGVLARELRIGRATMDCRLAVIAHRGDELADALRKFADDPAEHLGHADLRQRGGAPLVEELDETAAYLTALWHGRHLDALARLWLAGVDVTRGDVPGADGARPRPALPGTAMLRRPLAPGTAATGGPGR